MTEQVSKAGMGLSTRYAYAIAQGTFRLFTAGAIVYELHSYFLKFYANEWAFIQFNGPNRCSGIGRIASGTALSEATFCNEFINFFPWLKLYANHPGAVAAYYGTALGIVFLIAWIWRTHIRHRLRFGRKEVESQKAHGDARLATEAEALTTAATGAGRRSSIHDQEF